MAVTKRLLIWLLVVLYTSMLAGSANGSSPSTKTGDKKTKKAKFTDVGNFHNRTKDEKSSAAVGNAQQNMGMETSAAAKLSQNDSKTSNTTSQSLDGHKKKKHHKWKKIKNEVPVDSPSDLAVAAVPELDGAVGDGVLADRYSQYNVDLENIEYRFKDRDIMIISKSEKCPHYEDASRFEAQAREYTDILRYGCRGRDDKCCHEGSREIRVASSQLTDIVRRFTELLKNQCDKCPRNCEWGEWGAWGDCPLTCDRSNERRNRSRIEISARFGGMLCRDTPDVDFDDCPEIPRGLGQWTTWSPWSECHGRCDSVKYRKRTCVRPINAVCFTPCTGDDVQVVDCENDNCCPPPFWGSWEPWSPCDEESRTQTRRRSCVKGEIHNKPECSHLKCDGKEVETKDFCTCDEGKWVLDNWGQCQCPSGIPKRTKKRVPSDDTSNTTLCGPLTMEENITCDDCPECDKNKCRGLKDGQYPSCTKGCKKHIKCCSGEAVVGVCAGDLEYDSVCRQCVRRSTTCGIDNRDIHAGRQDLPDERECKWWLTGSRRQMRSRTGEPTV